MNWTKLESLPFLLFWEGLVSNHGLKGTVGLDDTGVDTIGSFLTVCCSPWVPMVGLVEGIGGDIGEVIG